MEFTDLFQNQHVRLTALRPADAAVIARWHDDSWFVRLINANPARPQAESQIQTWIDEMLKREDAFLFAVRLTETDELIGWIELDGVLWNGSSTMLGIAFGDRAYWDRGYGTEAMELALHFAFDELNLHRVGLNVYGYNERAIALYKKLGFTYEGAQREFLHRNGKRYDMLYYGMLRREWEARNVTSES
ncbi:MAG: GNAT family N-acetyltransferase [Caldilineae bacterium]|nr:GNAT family N-acetyltransferase [Anaerolineae bacterium]MCB0252230.1 GNAT family N-acetyltransferase [Anaerolineae bacterium]MCB9153579.1 GNAT family N-acetyltransferase [Caldilineae bacterium]